MKVNRFTGATTREALGLVREALGPDAMILANRNVAAGVEILACSEQDYESVLDAYDSPAIPDSAQAQNNTMAPDVDSIMDEIRSMRQALASQMHQLAWTGPDQRHPTRSALLQQLLALGFSNGLARQLTDKAPFDDIEQSVQWAKTMLARNVEVLQDERKLLDSGGIFALIGPTGVGKTTTTAKLAARYVMRHGPSKLALITTDGYRIGAHEQLRIYGKILGVMVHSVKDEVDLRIALDELSNKHTVLIDTVGMSQRDQMVAEQIAMLSGTKVPVKRLLCLNSTSTAQTLNEVVHAYRGSGLEGCIITKLDEAATISNVLDVVLRQKLRLFYLGVGQRVPEDLEVAQASTLVERAFEQRTGPGTSLEADSNLSALFETGDSSHNHVGQSSHVG